jgi:hypothetical protein
METVGIYVCLVEYKSGCVQMLKDGMSYLVIYKPHACWFHTSALTQFLHLVLFASSEHNYYLVNLEEIVNLKKPNQLPHLSFSLTEKLVISV